MAKKNGAETTNGANLGFERDMWKAADALRNNMDAAEYKHADLVDCMVALPGQLFYSTQIPVCLWFLTRSKSGKSSPLKKGDRERSERGDFRDRRGQTLSWIFTSKIALNYLFKMSALMLPSQ